MSTLYVDPWFFLILRPTLPPKVLKLTPHVSFPLLLELGVQLLQHCGHRLLVQLAGCEDREQLTRVILYQVEPTLIQS